MGRNSVADGCHSVGSTVTSFPNVSTQFRGGERLGKPKPAIGRRRARKLKKEVAVITAVYGSQRFEGDSLAFIRAVVSGEIPNPDPIRLGAAMKLVEFEYSRRSPTDAPPSASSLEQLILASHEHRMERAAVLSERARAIADIPDRLIEADPPAVEPDTRETELRASIAKAEAERDAILADIARHEQEQQDAEHRRQERLRLNGRGFIPFGQRR